MSLYEIRDLKIEFQTRMGTVQAVRGVSFDIEENECVALVGESEIQDGVVALKNMQTGEQQKLTMDEVIQYIKG